MHRSRLLRLTALLAAVVLVVALFAPSVAVAAVGGPYSESVSNPEDNIMAGPSGGSLDLHGVGTLVIPEGALAAPTSITAQVWNVRGGPKMPGGAEMRTLVELTPNGLTFANSATLSFVIPPDIDRAAAKIYGWDTDTSQWVAMAPSDGLDDDLVPVRLSHFSWYGIGGTPMTTTSTPASSSWSLALGAIAALGLALVVGRRRFAPVR